LRKLIDDPALARHMGEAGRRAVEQRFDMSKQLGPIIEVLRATAAGR
jgi:hypothetical protein